MGDDEKYIRDLISEGEHQQQDFKFEITSARKIAKTLVAFANTDGGRLLIGVKDNGRISGIRSDEEYYMIDAAATMYCRPEVRFDSYHHSVEGKEILEITVRPSDKKPHYARDEDNRWLAYHRVNDNNYLADYILLQVWKRRKRKQGTFIRYTENEKKVMQQLKTAESADLDVLREATGLKNKNLKQVLINLVSLQAVNMEYREEQCTFSVSDPDNSSREFKQ